MNSAPSDPRTGADFFLHPTSTVHRRYEALRAYFLDHLSLQEVAERFDYSLHTVASLVRDYRKQALTFFVEARPGPKSAPAKEAARPQVIRLRRQDLSVLEIEAALKDSATPLNRTGVTEILREEGFASFRRRPAAQRGGHLLEPLVRAGPIDFDKFPLQFHSEAAGIFLVLPELVSLDLPALVRLAGYPASPDIPALSYLLSMLALKLSAKRRLSHVKTLAHDPGYGLFGGLAAIPKTTALGTYSHRCQHSQSRELLGGLDQRMRELGLSSGGDFDLDFHAVMHYGNDPVLEEHYVPKRSQRTRSVLTFFAQDAVSRNLVYANADLFKATQKDEIVAFSDYWREVSGEFPSLLVIDSKVTTHAVLEQIDGRGIKFLTPRARHPALNAYIEQVPASQWKRIQLQRADGRRHVQVFDERAVNLPGYTGQVRQLAVKGLGHNNAMVLITNDLETSAKRLIERYSKRMGIEQRLAEWIQAFHIDALSSAVPLNVDLDIVLSVLAGAACDALRRRLPGYAKACPDTLQQRFLSTPGDITITDSQVVVRLGIRAYSPVIRQAKLPALPVPWWGGRRLVLQQP